MIGTDGRMRWNAYIPLDGEIPALQELLARLEKTGTSDKLLGLRAANASLNVTAPHNTRMVSSMWRTRLSVMFVMRFLLIQHGGFFLKVRAKRLNYLIAHNACQA